MTWRGYKIIIVTPAGRRRYLKLLLQQIIEYRNDGILDEYHLWKNTVDGDDILWMHEQQQQYSEFIKIIESEVPINVDTIGDRIASFHKYCIEDNTIYVRFDDDVVLLDNINAFKKFIDFRIDNQQYFMIYPTILNNSIITHLLQRQGKISTEFGIVNYECGDILGWHSPEFSCNFHNEILQKINTKKSLEDFYMNNWILYYNERVSINGIAWIGSKFRELCNGIIDINEEQDISVWKPQQFKMNNCIYGEYVIVHYAFHTQRKLLDGENYLQKYEEYLNS
jgi:hypothetical protein